MSTVQRNEPVDYDNISDQVRKFCAERLYELERSLRPLIDGSFGEVLPGHLAGYLMTVKQLGALYQVHKPPRDLDNTMPVSKVQELLAGMRAAHEAELAAVAAEAEARVRAELARGSKLTIEGAKNTVLTKLMELETRQA